MKDVVQTPPFPRSSLSQLERFGQAFPNCAQKVGIRVNPGVGSGGFSSSSTGFSKTNVGGPASSFGIWHELLTDGTVPAVVEKYGLEPERIHTHIGSGSDPAIWQAVGRTSLSFCALWDTVTALNLGGGYKVGRNPGEPTTDLGEIGAPVREAFEEFAAEHGRELKLEIGESRDAVPWPTRQFIAALAVAFARSILCSTNHSGAANALHMTSFFHLRCCFALCSAKLEPGTYLVANAGALVTTIQDKVSTKSPAGDEGHIFLKMDAGMTDVLRPSLYGAIHPITILPASGKSEDVGTATESVVVVGHCCESGDLMTPKNGEPEALEERVLRAVAIGDVAVMDGSGAYCAGMSTKNYNSFPEAPEVLVDLDGEVHLIRKRQDLKQIYQNECDVPSTLF